MRQLGGFMLFRKMRDELSYLCGWVLEFGSHKHDYENFLRFDKHGDNERKIVLPVHIVICNCRSLNHSEQVYKLSRFCRHLMQSHQTQSIPYPAYQFSAVQ